MRVVMAVRDGGGAFLVGESGAATATLVDVEQGCAFPGVVVAQVVGRGYWNEPDSDVLPAAAAALMEGEYREELHRRDGHGRFAEKVDVPVRAVSQRRSSAFDDLEYERSDEEWDAYRVENDEGSYCDDVARAVERDFFDWHARQAFGVYRDSDGEEYPHSYNVDGDPEVDEYVVIFDLTSDQFKSGLPSGARVLHPGDPDYDRYVFQSWDWDGGGEVREGLFRRGRGGAPVAFDEGKVLRDREGKFADKPGVPGDGGGGVRGVHRNPDAPGSESAVKPAEPRDVADWVKAEREAGREVGYAKGKNVVQVASEHWREGEKIAADLDVAKESARRPKRDSIPEEQRKVLWDYRSTLAGAEAMHVATLAVVDGSATPEQAEMVRLMDEAVAFQPGFEEAVTLFRGVPARNPLTRVRPGQRVAVDTVLSTTAEESFAFDWARDFQNDARGAVMLAIQVPRGLRAALTTPSTLQRDKMAELVLPRGLEFEVVAWDERFDHNPHAYEHRPEVVLRVVGGGDPSVWDDALREAVERRMVVKGVRKAQSGDAPDAWKRMVVLPDAAVRRVKA